MDIQKLIEKINKEKLSKEELQQLNEFMGAGLEKLQKDNPKKYLELLKELNEAISDLNRDLKELKALAANYHALRA